MIKQHFLESINKYATDTNVQQSYWQEIQKLYSSTSRHYHTLAHLNTLILQLNEIRRSFSDWDVIVFAIAYHDIVYNVLKTNNELKSAELSMKRLRSTSFPAALIDRCNTLILATKMHEPSDRETNLFTDADLSILGSAPGDYREYTRQIRQEYSIFPDLIYNPGRKKVLIHFLEMSRIFKTPEFGEHLEKQARENLAEELDLLK